VRKREPFRPLAPRTLFPLSPTLVKRELPATQTNVVCITYKYCKIQRV
jgi:hypothetical protein